MMKRKLLAMFMVIAMIVCYMPAIAFAEVGGTITKAAEPTFVDMPDNWSKTALQAAVNNGLIKGYEGNKGMEIRGTGNLTRAEMATVVNRAFGATEKTILKGVTDVANDAWYSAEMQKAVKMGTREKREINRWKTSYT